VFALGVTALVVALLFGPVWEPNFFLPFLAAALASAW